MIYMVLNLRLSQNRQHVKCGQKTTLFALLEISPDESTQLVQRRRHVTIVIDCSGSMYGKKIEDAKNAALGVINKLDPNDLISIVTFASEVDVLLNSVQASDHSIEGVIRSIVVGGGTAMHGGMVTALNLLKEVSDPQMLNRMEVFSDGEPNVEPYDDIDFMNLSQEIRDNGMSVDVFGIGDDYQESLLMQIAETGRGNWEHVSNTNELTKMVTDHVENMQNTVIINPQLQITLMPGAELITVAITKPILQEIGSESRTQSGQTISIGLHDIMKDESQTVAMRVTIPPVNGNDITFMTATVTGESNQIASQNGIISCSQDKDLYNMEADPSPRAILASSEATILFRKGLEGDSESTRMANTILKSLDDPETTKLMDNDAYATVLNAQKISGNIQSGLSESEKKQILHDTTMIGVTSATNKDENITNEAEELVCLDCGHRLRPTSKICGNCGKNINK